jgi:hypothetical protein
MMHKYLAVKFIRSYYIKKERLASFPSISWHDGTISDINVSYQAYYAGTYTIVDSHTLPGIKAYFNGNGQKFPCSANVTIHYAPLTPSEEYLWSTPTCN